ncbi:MAG: hypothetical protein FD189_343 [Elusimicrobia bacterium]|nr:MAG: hypothetical protein FD154_423 [Elusimicrobiota bacterium]KAF0157822.1 MAG: hypothetical protein FD189_343 [Elusimicrobiota bacterium]
MRGALLAAVLLSASFSAPARAAGPAMELYFEAMDGASWQWFFMADAARRRLPAAKMEVLPLVAKGESGWVSKRGEPELEESARIAWISAERPDALFNYLNGRSLSPWADGWRDAALFSGLDPDELGKKSSEAREKLLGGLYERSAARKADSTALYINGELYEGGQRLLELYAALNAALPEAERLYKPSGDTMRNGVPGAAAAAPRTPKMWVLASEKDGIAGDQNVAGAFKRYFAGLRPKELEYSSSEARRLLKAPKSLPAYVIEDTPEVRKAFEQAIAAGAFEQAGKNFVYYDKGRKSLLTLEKHLPGELELFTMSMCPYGVQAENSLVVAYRQGLLPKGTKLRLRYIADAVTDEKGGLTFNSLQGTPEWEENARQLFIKKTFPDKFYDYLLTRNKDVRSSRWETAAEAAGVDPAAVSAGFEEGKRLLAEDVKRARALGVGSSPTFLVDGRVLVTGLGGLTQLKGFEKIPVNPSAQDMACGQ